MYQFGGRQVALEFSENLRGPGLKTLKCGKAKHAPFWMGSKVETIQKVNWGFDVAKKHKGPSLWMS